MYSLCILKSHPKWENIQIPANKNVWIFTNVKNSHSSLDNFFFKFTDQPNMISLILLDSFYKSIFYNLLFLNNSPVVSKYNADALVKIIFESSKFRLLPNRKTCISFLWRQKKRKKASKLRIFILFLQKVNNLWMGTKAIFSLSSKIRERGSLDTF